LVLDRTQQLRQRTKNPEFMSNVERLILNSKEARQRLGLASRQTARRIERQGELRMLGQGLRQGSSVPIGSMPQPSQLSLAR
jgi:hypothetical protein